MNVQRLHSVLGRLRTQIRSAEVEQRLQELENTLQQQNSNPTQPSFQTQVFSALENLRSALRTAQDSPTNAFWLEALDEIGLRFLLPGEIFARANAIVQENQITPAVALERIKALRTEIVTSRERIDRLIEGLDLLGIKDPEIPMDKAEIAVLIPRAAIDNNLDNFGEEVKDVNRFLNTLAEAVTGSAEDIKIESVSSSELLLFLLLGPKIVKWFAEALRELLGIGKDYLEILLVYENLKQKKLGTAVLQGLQEENNKRIDTSIAEIVQKILGESKASDADKNDLRNKLQVSLKAIWNRIRKGYSFDVRASDAAENSDDEQISNYAKEINEIGKTIERASIEAEKLPELSPAPPDATEA